MERTYIEALNGQSEPTWPGEGFIDGAQCGVFKGLINFSKAACVTEEHREMLEKKTWLTAYAETFEEVCVLLDADLKRVFGPSAFIQVFVDA